MVYKNLVRIMRSKISQLSNENKIGLSLVDIIILATAQLLGKVLINESKIKHKKLPIIVSNLTLA